MIIKTKIENLKNYKIYLNVEQATHEFFQKKGYLKVDLPVLSPALIPESYLEVFEREFNMLEYYRVGFTYLQLADEILEMLRYISSSLSFRAKSRNLLQSPIREISPLSA